MIAHVIRLGPGDDLVEKIESYLAEHKIEAAYLAMTIGSLSHLKIRFASNDNYTDFNENFEIISAQGTLSIHGSHIHGSFAQSSGTVIGGHIRSGCIIRTTAEIVLHELSGWKLTRSYDSKTGYQELQTIPPGEK